MRDGRLVEKRLARLAEAMDRAERSLRDDMLGMPMISRMDPYESPVTGAEITSWRQRDADMQAADAVDPRDLKEAKHARPDKPQSDDAPFQWGGPGG
jgi:hypothetical protein